MSSLISTIYMLETYGPRVNMAKLAIILGYEPKSLHNRIARGELSLPTYVDGKERFADTRDVAEYLDTMRAKANALKMA